MQKQKSFCLRKFQIADFIRLILTSWLFAAVAEYWLLPHELRDLALLHGLAQMSFIRVVGMTCVITLAQWILSHGILSAKTGRWSLTAAFAVLAFTALQSSATWPFMGVCCLIFAVLVIFGIYGWDSSPEPAVKPQASQKVCLCVTVGLSAAFFLFVSSWTVGRVYSFSSPTYDFGIFSQMFYSMKESGLPMTTVERDGLLSHFAVHVSPIYYLMLPLYWLFPRPATLQVLQSAIITSAVIPLWKIGKQNGLTGVQGMLLCMILLVYPAFSGGTSYDIHENCFLTPLILWLFYGIDRKNTMIAATAAVLTLMVKEDAAVYVAVIALWLIVKTILRFPRMDLHNLIAGIMLFTVSLGWFFAITGYLSENGDGVMTYRYKNFLYDDSASLTTVLKSVILNPMKAVYECVDTEKLKFIAQTLLPLLGLPLLTRRFERYILLIPYILVNLMSDYPYQHDIFFQYTFGSDAFLLYLTAINLSDVKTNRKRTTLLAVAAIVSAMCFCKFIIPKAVFYPAQAIRYYDEYQNIREALDTIPESASVAASTFYTAYLSQRETLYDVRYCSWEHLTEAEYVVLKLSIKNDYTKYAAVGEDSGLDNLMKLLEDHGYEPFLSLKNVLIIYCKELRSV